MTVMIIITRAPTRTPTPTPRAPTRTPESASALKYDPDAHDVGSDPNQKPGFE